MSYYVTALSKTYNGFGDFPCSEISAPVHLAIGDEVTFIEDAAVVIGRHFQLEHFTSGGVEASDNNWAIVMDWGGLSVTLYLQSEETKVTKKMTLALEKNLINKGLKT